MTCVDRETIECFPGGGKNAITEVRFDGHFRRGFRLVVASSNKTT